MSKHTPGPWKVKYGINVFGGKRSVANCGGYTSNTSPDNDLAENEANARLIAAAPDMLAMLKTVTTELEAEIMATYSCYTDAALNVIHPALIRRYNRNMQPVRDAQALILAI